MRSDSTLRSPIPRWHIALLLVGFPPTYLVNSIAPWYSALFGRNDRSAWFTFWITVLILHWVRAGLTVYWVRTSGNPLSAIGLTVSPTYLAIVAATVLVLGAALVCAPDQRPPAGSSTVLPAWVTVLYPQTPDERCLWMVVALSGSCCEEVVYRGFGIPALVQRGYRWWHAVALAILAFVFVHGLAGLFGLPTYFGIGVCFAGLFLGRKSSGSRYGRWILQFRVPAQAPVAILRRYAVLALTTPAQVPPAVNPIIGLSKRSCGGCQGPAGTSHAWASSSKPTQGQWTSPCLVTAWHAGSVPVDNAFWSDDAEA